MNGIEMGRKALEYGVNTAKEVSGIGAGQRARREFDSLTIGTIFGASHFSIPLVAKSVEGRPVNVGPLVKLGTEVLALSIFLTLVGERHFQAAFVAKFGYDLLVQVAPDVARLFKLTKGKVFQRPK